MYFVYMIINGYGKLYIGVSVNPEGRLKEHNTKRGSVFTKSGSFKIIFKERHSTLAEARRREIQIKKWRRGKKEMLIKQYQKGLSTKIQENLPKIKIIYQDQDVLVIEKPAGLTVHPVENKFHGASPSNTLVNQLIKQFPEIKNVGDPSTNSGQENLRPGIVHRLDKDTSGLMIIARNNSSFDFLKKQFQERKVVKKYLALVFGKVKDKKGVITKSISFSKKDRKKRSPLLDEKSKKAWTEYSVLKYFNNFTLLEVGIKTGRTHQIRVHLASIGHPIAGDSQYKFKRQIPPSNLKRQFLHAAVLKIKLPSGKMMEFNSELPHDLKGIIKTLS